VPAADGIVYDTDRIMFLRSYLTQLQRATSQACECAAISIGA
jgi:beta-glucosidase